MSVPDDLARTFPDNPGALRRLRARLAAAEAGGVLDIAYRTLDSRRAAAARGDQACLSEDHRATVLHRLADIGYGHTASYGAAAALAGNPKAVRAVGTACATNPSRSSSPATAWCAPTAAWAATSAASTPSAPCSTSRPVLQPSAHPDPASSATGPVLSVRRPPARGQWGDCVGCVRSSSRRGVVGVRRRNAGSIRTVSMQSACTTT